MIETIKKLEIKELTTLTEMMAQLETIKYLYPKMSLEQYEALLQEMLPHNYKQVAVFEDGECVGITGYWFGTKLWCGKFIEIDNFVVHPDHRSKGIGKHISDYINSKAEELGCVSIVLDAYTNNFPAHRFYYNQGFGPKGFHFVKILNADGLN
ncbi:GNAT family N-acetyltransferase [Flavobacterium sp. GT3R68]|uniref:GNAT family N-acetyltransferase n=1 Tax=Flavobacterium sp. GT3R68 TaxID=2594437 RepID=UPI000F897791|nr:GNAT family N-acetyltransferase [Flavobacterium sp. GT3R68]RTY95946.1 GNAT family N-acetyltransferase [Flavobacterium sp. GSN2]TRW93718.1 GNAT family N-acetyltransferase [Flavobacterium sp. GT3R68]